MVELCLHGPQRGALTGSSIANTPLALKASGNAMLLAASGTERAVGLGRFERAAETRHQVGDASGNIAA